MEKQTTRQSFTVPIGPQHPALKEPSHFRISVDGEIVTDASVRLGYAHRGIEKATESRTWIQNLYLLERICGICSAIRVLFAVLERILCDLLCLGGTAVEAVLDSIFLY
ncbi:MAG: hypothetical protein P8Z42_14815 [Anaerolineales bacterium]